MLRSLLGAGLDSDEDGKTDLAKLLPSGYLLWLNSSTSTCDIAFVGMDGIMIEGNDLDRDAKAHPAKFISSGFLRWMKSSNGS